MVAVLCPPAAAQAHISAISTGTVRPWDVIDLLGEFTPAPGDQVVAIQQGSAREAMRIVHWSNTRVMVVVPEVAAGPATILVMIPGPVAFSNRVDITILGLPPEAPSGVRVEGRPYLRRVFPAITIGEDVVIYGEYFGDRRDDVGVWYSNADGARLMEIVTWDRQRIQVRAPALDGAQPTRPGRYDVAIGHTSRPPQFLSNHRPLILRRLPLQIWERRPRRVVAVEPRTIAQGEVFDILGENLVLMPGETVHIDTRERLEALASPPFFLFPLDTRPLGTELEILEVAPSRIRARLTTMLTPGEYRVGIINMEVGLYNISPPLANVR